MWPLVSTFQWDLFVYPWFDCITVMSYDIGEINHMKILPARIDLTKQFLVLDMLHCVVHHRYIIISLDVELYSIWSNYTDIIFF